MRTRSRRRVPARRLTSRLGLVSGVALLVVAVPATLAVAQADRTVAERLGSDRPRVSSVSPPAGPSAGATEVRLVGTNLGRVRAVLFGDQRATILKRGARVLRVSAPPSADPVASATEVAVRVSGRNGSSALTPRTTFTYLAAPVVRSLSPGEVAPACRGPVAVTGTALTTRSGSPWATRSHASGLAAGTSPHCW